MIKEVGHLPDFHIDGYQEYEKEHPNTDSIISDCRIHAFK